MTSLLAALRHLATVGDETQRHSARLILEGAARTVTSILANGSVAPEPSGAELDVDGAAEATARNETETPNETATTV